MRQRAERPHHGSVSGRQLLRVATAVAFPPELAFLPCDLVDRATLGEAARQARVEEVCAARVLIATGHISASTYYRALAADLGVPFIDGWPDIGATDITSSIHSGYVELTDASPLRWLAAPQDETLLALLDEHRSGQRWSDLAITTPAHLVSLVHFHAQDAIEDAASHALPAERPSFSARGIFGKRTAWGLVATFVCLAPVLYLTLRPVVDLLGFLFLLGISFRIIVCANGRDPLREPHRRLSDAQLPFYTVLVPLHGEADIVPDLLTALDALDYPRAKLEVLVLIEPEDLSTRAALDKARLPPWLQVVFGPVGGELRTKPRALNIGLMTARGTLLTIFDAEDRPCPDQLRQAAALFADAPDELACLQARLWIDNGAQSLLARMFAVEYATLFDLLNIGISHLRLPMALGGTSCHFPGMG